MSKVLNNEEIAARMEEEFFDGNESVKDGDYRRGNLPNGRTARIMIKNYDGMLSVRLMVPGDGSMSIGFNLFPEDATPERIDRHIEHAAKSQKKNMARWAEMYA